MIKFNLSLTKRHKFFAVALLLSVVLLILRLPTMSFLAWRYRVLGFAIFSVLSTIFALKDEDFSGIEWVTLTILPVMFAVSGAMIYPLMPSEIGQILIWSLDTDGALFLASVVKFLYLILFGIGVYAVLLTENIFNIAGLKTIQLTRVGHSVGFFLSLVTALFFYLVIYSFHFSDFWNFILVFAVTFPLSLQSVWSFVLEKKVSRVVTTFSLAIALAVAQIAWVLSFWPITNFVYALFLTALLYELIGVIQYHLSGRLTRNLVFESIFIMAIFLCLTVFSASWTGG